MSPPRHYLSGCDYVMLALDYEMRKHGYPGNSCQIILDLVSPVSPTAMRERAAEIARAYPELNSRRRGRLRPYWKLPRGAARPPEVRVHRAGPDAVQQVMNTPLRPKLGEQARFDLIEQDGQASRVIFTWAHSFMDAPSAENFLAVFGRNDIPLPKAHLPPPPRPPMSWRTRIKLSWKHIRQYEEFSKNAPKSPGVRRPQEPHMVQYRLERFTPEETKTIRANSVKHCGMLREAQFHAAVATLELHRLHQRIGRPSPSYVIPVPVALRPKGTVEPLFSNQVTMLMLQLLPAQLVDIKTAADAIKEQTAAAMRTGMVDTGRLFMETLRFLPMPIYMGFAKQSLKGEISSLYYGNTAAVSPLLTSFMGAGIEEFTHIAAVPPSPGIGSIFYYFKGEMRISVLNLAPVLSEAEAAEFAAGLRARLLQP